MNLRRLHNELNQYVISRIEGMGEFHAVEHLSDHRGNYTPESISSGLIKKMFFDLFMICFFGLMLTLCFCFVFGSVSLFFLLLPLSIVFVFLAEIKFSHKTSTNALAIVTHFLISGRQTRVLEIQAFYQEVVDRRNNALRNMMAQEARQQNDNLQALRRMAAQHGANFQGRTMSLVEYQEMLRRERYQPAPPTPRKPYEIYEDELKEKVKNLQSFTEEFFTRSQSLARFLGESLKDEKGELNMFLLRTILLIPKRKTLSIDAVKSIVQSAKQLQDSGSGFYNRDILMGLSKDPDIMALLFKNYSEQDLKTLLTNRYTGDQFFKWIIQVAEEGYTENPNVKFIAHIVDNPPRKLVISKLKDLESLPMENGYSFKVFSKKNDFVQAKEDFKNCIMSYFERRDTDTFGLYQNGNPVACVSISPRFEILQIKAPFNNQASVAHVAVVRSALSLIQNKAS